MGMYILAFLCFFNLVYTLAYDACEAIHAGTVYQWQGLYKDCFDNNFVNVSLNFTKFGMLIDNIEIDMLDDFGCYGNHFGGKL